MDLIPKSQAQNLTPCSSETHFNTNPQIYAYYVVVTFPYGDPTATLSCLSLSARLARFCTNYG